MWKIRKDQIKEYINIGSKALGSNILLSHPLQENIVNSLSNGFNDKTKYAHWIATFIANCYGLKALPICVIFEKMIDEKAGSISYKHGTWYICIDDKYYSNDVQVISIVAHEMAHVLLAHRDIKIEPTIRNEELTDTVSVLAGFGKSIYAVCLKESFNPILLFVGILSLKREKLGYLAKNEILFISRLKEKIAFQQSIKRLCPINLDKIRHVMCYACGSKLLLQNRKGIYDIKCPICKMKQTVKQELYSNRILPFYVKFGLYLRNSFYKIADYIRGFD